jgi:hypothetical protein
MERLHQIREKAVYGRLLQLDKFTLKLMLQDMNLNAKGTKSTLAYRIYTACGVKMADTDLHHRFAAEPPKQGMTHMEVLARSAGPPKQDMPHLEKLARSADPPLHSIALPKKTITVAEAIAKRPESAVPPKKRKYDTTEILEDAKSLQHRAGVEWCKRVLDRLDHVDEENKITRAYCTLLLEHLNA